MDSWPSSETFSLDFFPKPILWELRAYIHIVILVMDEILNIMD